MKRCPQCRRDYYDDSLNYCLDDGATLVDGPASDAPPTAILHRAEPSSEAVTKTLGASRSDTEERTPRPAERKKIFSILVTGILLLAALGLFGYFYLGGGAWPARQIGSVAVMPFVNASGDPDIEYLSDGITESLINSISQVPNVTVKARSSVFTYKGKEVSPKQVAQELSVEAILTGRVVRLGEQIQLSVELVDAGTGNHLWGESYTRKQADLLKLQSEIARDVSNKLRIKLTGAEQRKIEKNYTEITEAFHLHLRGRYHLNKRRTDDIKKGVEYFRQAVDTDPTYALAYAGLAEAYILFPDYGIGSPHEYYPKARAAAEKAIEIDPALAEARIALASVMSNYEWRFADAEAEYRKALELNPNYATGHQWYAEYLFAMGRFPEALEEMRRAQQLDPLSLIINGLVGVMLRANGQNEQAVEQLQKTLEMDPTFPRGHLFLAETYQAMGRYEEAIEEFAKGFTLNGSPPDKLAANTERVRKALRSGGPKAYARAMAESLDTARTPPVILAGYWARAGETHKAFEVLEEAYERRDFGLLMLKTGRLQGFESDPRYRSLLQRIGLPE